MPTQKTNAQTRQIEINRTYILTSKAGIQEDLDFVETYITRTCLNLEALKKFAEVFNVTIEAVDK